MGQEWKLPKVTLVFNDASQLTTQFRCSGPPNLRVGEKSQVSKKCTLDPCIGIAWAPWQPSRVRKSALCDCHCHQEIARLVFLSRSSLDTDLLKSFQQRASVLREVLRNEEEVNS